MSRTKTIRESDTQRVYRTEKGAAVSCSIQHQAQYDLSDGQEAGYWGWCGPVDDQSDYVIGSYDSVDRVFAAYTHPKHVRMQSVTLYQDRAPEFQARLRLVEAKS